MSKVYVGDTGTQIILDCGQNISTATATTILARKPDGTEATWTAALSGTNSVVYTTSGSSIDQHGMWYLQARVTLPSGVWRGETAQLFVSPNFA